MTFNRGEFSLRFGVIFMFWVILLGCAGSHALAADPVSWSITALKSPVAAGDTVIVTVKARIDDGWHIYGLNNYISADGGGPQKTEITITGTSLKLLGSRIRTSKALAVFDSSFEVNVEKFKHSAELYLPVTSSRKLPAGTYTAEIVVYYQACTSKNCLPPKEVKIPLKVEVVAAKVPATGVEPEESQQSDPSDAPPSTQPATKDVPTDKTAKADNSGPVAPVDATQDVPPSLMALILLAMGFGASSWVMPCVYPMIPITVSFFTKRSEKEHTRPITDSLVYSAGIMSTYIVFGAVAAIFFGATAGRDFASNPWVNLVLAALFVVIAGNLFGMYEIALPASLVNSLNRKSSQTKGYGASFIMGMVFSLTAFTCTVPFIDLVGKISAGGEWFRPIIGMGVYSAVFALPFFLLALFPSSLTRLPKSGAWMNNIKVVFGFVELAFAVSYFARVDSLAGLDILSREAVLSIWAGCSLLITLYVLGVYRMQLDGNPGHIGGMRAILAVVFASLTLYIFDGIKSSSVGPLEPFVYVESSNTNVSAAGATSEMGRSGGQNELYNGQWLDDLDSALAIAKKINKPVFIDFTGISCTNCRWMEKNMFPKPEIRALMQQMVLVRAYTDRRHVSQDKKYQEMQEQRFHSTLLPLYVLLTPNDTFIASSTYTPSTQEFASFLKKAVPGDVNISALSPAH
jgi:thiol:disulfide interchange protein DsbD